MLPTKGWREFFLYLGRVIILLFLLAVLLPKLVAVCNSWMSSLWHNDYKPLGNPLRVNVPLRDKDNVCQAWNIDRSLKSRNQ